MNDTLTLPTRPGRLRGREGAAGVVAVALFALLVLTAWPVLTTPPAVDRLEVTNETPWPVQLSLRAPGERGWTPLGVAPALAGTAFSEIPDPGARWQLRFRYAGTEVVTSVTRAAVAGDGWVLSVPVAFTTEMESASVPVAPPTES